MKRYNQGILVAGVVALIVCVIIFLPDWNNKPIFVECPSCGMLTTIYVPNEQSPRGVAKYHKACDTHILTTVPSGRRFGMGTRIIWDAEIVKEKE